MPKPKLHQWHQSGATDGQVVTWDQAAMDGAGEWTAQDPAGGGVQSIVEGTGITVDDTDPANPIVSATGSGVGSSLTPPTQIATATGFGSAGAGSITVPAGAQAGDLLVVTSASFGTPATPSGGNVANSTWSVLGTATGTFLQAITAVAIATATSAGSTIAVAGSGGFSVSGSVTVVRGWSTVTGMALSQTGVSSTSLASGALMNGALPGNLVVGFGAVRVTGITLTSNLSGSTLATRTSDTNLSIAVWAASPTTLLRHVVTTGTSGTMVSGAVAIAGL